MLDGLEDDLAALEVQETQLQATVDELRGQVELVALARYVESGTEGIPLLTDVSEPQDQIQAEVYVDILTNIGADTLDQYDAAEKALRETQDEVADRQERSRHSARSSPGSRRWRWTKSSGSERSKPTGSRTKRCRRRSKLDWPPNRRARRTSSGSRPRPQLVHSRIPAWWCRRPPNRRPRRCPTPGCAADDRRRRQRRHRTRDDHPRDTPTGDHDPREQWRVRRHQRRPHRRRWRWQRSGRHQHRCGLRRRDHLPDARLGLRRHLGGTALRGSSPRGRRHDRSSAACRSTRSSSGVVTFKFNRLGGNAVSLAGDNGNRYYYGHLDSYVGGSRRVFQGEVIGYNGDTGNAKFHAAPPLRGASGRWPRGQSVSLGARRRLLICQARRRWRAPQDRQRRRARRAAVQCTRWCQISRS